jgi:hypothetical protein
LTQDKNAVFHEYIFDIKDAVFAMKDDPDKYIMRLEIQGKKFFAHRNRTKEINNEIISAIFHPKVHEI